MDNIDIYKYCRFCAEPKGADKLLNLQDDVEKCNEILLKLAFVNALYVNVNSDNVLPRTVCFICYDSLNKAYEFLVEVKRAQEVLTNLLIANEEYKPDVSDDERSCGFEDYLSNDAVEDRHNDEMQVQSRSPDEALQTNMNNDENDINFVIKKEPKEEITDANILEALNHEDGQIENHSLNLNVHDLLEVAMSNGPSNIVLYAKDFSEIKKRDVKTWKDYPWVCAFCNIEFLDLDTLRSHSKIVHGKCSAFVCIDCKETKINNLNSFLKHVRKHRKSLRNYCYYCHELIDKKFVTLSVHVKKHVKKPQVACVLCGEILQNEESLKCHLQEYSLTKRKRRPRRKPGTPITIEDLTCPLCKKLYKNPNSLRDHMKLHTADRKRNYTCDRCGKMFYNKGTLTSHIMSHDKVRPHVCRICNKSFLFPNMLRRHVEMHSGVKPFSCEQCGRCFRLQYQLNAHKIVHTDSMPHVCQYCNKAFRFKQILKNHERQHTGAKPYSCQNCGMEFTNWSNYNKHMKRRHGLDTSKKKITPDGVFPVNPETGQIMQVIDPVGTEEWKNKIMIPSKRGKKKSIKQENEAS